MVDIVTLGPLIVAISSGGGAVIGAIVWIVNLQSRVVNAEKENRDIRKDLDREVAEFNKEIAGMEGRLREVEGHKSSVAVLEAQMDMVLRSVEEMSKDVKKLLDGHARLSSRD